MAVRNWNITKQLQSNNLHTGMGQYVNLKKQNFPLNMTFGYLFKQLGDFRIQFFKNMFCTSYSLYIRYPYENYFVLVFDMNMEKGLYIPGHLKIVCIDRTFIGANLMRCPSISIKDVSHSMNTYFSLLISVIQYHQVPVTLISILK